jgi:spatacsin
VKSLAWASCCSSSQLDDPIFKELLVVSSDDSITVHAFFHSFTSTPTVDSTSDTRELHGEWKEWSPADCSMLEDGVSGPKNWSRSFMTTLTASVSNGKYQAIFPVKSLLPHSAEVLSFSIYDTTLSFLKFWYCECHRRTSMEAKSESPQGFLSRPVDEAPCSCRWECIQVLASSSGHLIGLVLTPDESVTCDDHQYNAKRILVAVLELYQWGIQWNFVADLQNVQFGEGPSPKWVDFQLSDMFLACLSATGFIAIWNVKTGGLATSFSVLQHCITDQEMPLRSNMPIVTNLNDGKNSAGNLVGRMFKRLVLASYSLVLAVVDEVGVIYVFYTDDILNFKATLHENIDLSSMNHFGDNVSAWGAAGHEIGSLSFCNHPSIEPGSLHPAELDPKFSVEIAAGVLRPRKRRKQCRYSRDQVDTWPSGFDTAQMKVAASHLDSVTASSSLRRVLLPLYRLHEDAICLSPLGLTRIFQDFDGNGNKHAKIVHTELLMYSSFLDERDINVGLMDNRLPFQKDFSFTKDYVVSSFQGYLYLITQDSLYVVLPSVSVSSFSCHGDAIKFWKPSFADVRSCNALNLLSINRYEARWKAWQIDVLDRALLYEGPALADRLCRENGVFSFQLNPFL